jgi:hypothetical protein
MKVILVSMLILSATILIIIIIIIIIIKSNINKLFVFLLKYIDKYEQVLSISHV